ncbi:MAG TPA: ABC transporter ATP-binding protein [Steroidobacteraceae bacterium]|nr:ABC transporter ATP-binding protein [Steroidobacteraceae bacterium]
MSRGPTLPPQQGVALHRLPREFLEVFTYGRKAMQLVWQTSRRLTIWLALLTLLAGALPALIAWLGARIVDAVVAAAAGGGELAPVLELVALEGVAVAVLALCTRALSLATTLLREQLGFRVNSMILEKALTLDLEHFEDSEFYDRMTRARREASARPLSLVQRTFALAQNLVSLASFGVLLWQFSPWAVGVLLLAGLPGFVAEARFSNEAFRLFRWRSAERRMQVYLETVIAREDHAKEVKLYALGQRLLDRYRAIHQRLFVQERRLAIRRDSWGFALGLLGTAALYGGYSWVAISAVRGNITLGEMTMYLLLFRQGQSAVSAALGAISGLYEDNLYLSTLYEYLETEPRPPGGTGRAGPDPADGLRMENVSFSYPGAEQPALSDVSLHLPPGRSLALVGANGSGKTTLIKLLTRLYVPTAGRILLDGRDLADWDVDVLRQRFGVIFQDYVRYQMLVGENIGAGDEHSFEDEARWREAAALGEADEMIEALPEGYRTQLGKWFQGGRELSGGQWQKVAVSRSFMRRDADIRVLDEPTAAMDAEAEAEVFRHVRDLAEGRMTILISHRFSTVRMADEIIVLDAGRVVERGDHAALMGLKGVYERLFALQAQGYR